jgi:ABC-type sugar transport system ATPase subunit
MNILDAEPRRPAAGLRCAGGHVRHCQRAPRTPLHGAVKFGLRPEHIGIAPLEGSAPVPARLRFAEHMGNEVFVHAEIGNLPLTARVPALQAEALHASARGAELTLHLQMDAAHLFDAASGVSLA